MLITLPIAVDKEGKISAEQYARIANGVVQVEVLTTAEARVYLIEPSQASFDRWKGWGWFDNLKDDNDDEDKRVYVRGVLYTKLLLDEAAAIEGSPVRDWVRSRTEQIEEITHG